MRSIGRLVAFQALYQEDMNPGSTERNWNQTLEAYCVESKTTLTGDERVEVLDFAKRLFEGARDRRVQIDEIIENVLENRTLARVNVVERNVLRVATYEMRFLKTPKAVVISEALELGKKFGEKETTGFLNGVLDRVD